MQWESISTQGQAEMQRTQRSLKCKENLFEVSITKQACILNMMIRSNPCTVVLVQVCVQENLGRGKAVLSTLC